LLIRMLRLQEVLLGIKSVVEECGDWREYNHRTT
jgi:hypothetical protein